MNQQCQSDCEHPNILLLDFDMYEDRTGRFIACKLLPVGLCHSCARVTFSHFTARAATLTPDEIDGIVRNLETKGYGSYSGAFRDEVRACQQSMEA